MISKSLLLIAASTVVVVCALTSTAQVPAKNKLAGEVSDLMFTAFPPGALTATARKEVENSTSNLEQVVITALMEKVKGDTALTEQQKQKARERLPVLSSSVVAKMKEIGYKGFDVEQWMRDGVTENFSATLTVNELQAAKRYLSSPGGRSYLSELRETAGSGAPGGPVDPPFFRTVAGKKLLAALNDRVRFDRRFKAWATDMQAELMRSIQTGEIAAMVKDFRASLDK